MTTLIPNAGYRRPSVMTESIDTSALRELAQRVDTIEEAYEFMLAYAAQGRENEGGTSAPGIRTFVERFDTALLGLADAAAGALCASNSEVEQYEAFIEVLSEDAKKTQSITRLVLGRQIIDSQLIDNVNASIHLRALLTDLFLIASVVEASGEP